MFDPTGKNNQVSTGEGCSIKPKTESDVTLKGIDLSGLPVLNPESSDSLFMIGCYHCDYTRKAYPMVRDLVKRYGARFSFINFPTKEDNDYFSRLGYCVNQQAPDKYWEFNDILFTGEKTRLDDKDYMNQTLTGLGLNPSHGRILHLRPDHHHHRPETAERDESDQVLRHPHPVHRRKSLRRPQAL